MTNNVIGDELRKLSATAILEYAFPEASLPAGLARKPHLIAVDAGSSAPGGCYLGAGVSFTTPDRASKRDRRHMLVAGRPRISVVIGTAGSVPRNGPP
jgi:hypothetical protein